MSVYKYKYKRVTYYYFRVNIKGSQFSRRFDKGCRFRTPLEAELAESRFLYLKGGIQNKTVIYVYQLHDDFYSFLQQRYKYSSLYSIMKSFDNHILPLIKEERIDRLSLKTSKTINEYLSHLEMKNPKNVVSAAKNFYRFLLTYEISIPLDSIIYPKKFTMTVEKDCIRFWNLEQFKRFISVVDDPYWKLMFLCFYYYGLRVGELRGIKLKNFTSEHLIIDNCVSNCNFEGKQIDISPKTNSSIRTYPMFNIIWECYLKCSIKGEYLFSSLQDEKLAIGHTTIRRKLLKYCKLANVPFINIHGFRHSCASLLINQGMDSLQVARWLGHSNPQVTLTYYAHLFEKRNDAVFDLLNNI